MSQIAYDLAIERGDNVNVARGYAMWWSRRLSNLGGNLEAVGALERARRLGVESCLWHPEAEPPPWIPNTKGKAAP